MGWTRGQQESKAPRGAAQEGEQATQDVVVQAQTFGDSGAPQNAAKWRPSKGQTHGHVLMFRRVQDMLQPGLATWVLPPFRRAADRESLVPALCGSVSAITHVPDSPTSLSTIITTITAPRQHPACVHLVPTSAARGECSDIHFLDGDSAGTLTEWWTVNSCVFLGVRLQGDQLGELGAP